MLNTLRKIYSHLSRLEAIDRSQFGWHNICISLMEYGILVLDRQSQADCVAYHQRFAGTLKVCNTFHSLSVSIKFFNRSISWFALMCPAITRCMYVWVWVCVLGFSCNACLLYSISSRTFNSESSVVIKSAFAADRRENLECDFVWSKGHQYIYTVILVTLSVRIEPVLWLLKDKKRHDNPAGTFHYDPRQTVAIIRHCEQTELKYKRDHLRVPFKRQRERDSFVLHRLGKSPYSNLLWLAQGISKTRLRSIFFIFSDIIKM